jgi:hypothetical protein
MEVLLMEDLIIDFNSAMEWRTAQAATWMTRILKINNVVVDQATDKGDRQFMNPIESRSRREIVSMVHFQSSERNYEGSINDLKNLITKILILPFHR